jgi:hypothetical protein
MSEADEKILDLFILTAPESYKHDWARCWVEETYAIEEMRKILIKTGYLEAEDE